MYSYPALSPILIIKEINNRERVEYEKWKKRKEKDIFFFLIKASNMKHGTLCIKIRFPL